MPINLSSLCNAIESQVSGVSLIPLEIERQIKVLINERPDVQIFLLTPWYQQRLKASLLCQADVDDPIRELKRVKRSREWG